MGYLDAQAGDAERTAFRRAEKRYKFYKHSSTSARSAKHRESVPPTDLSEVLDFHRIKCFGATKESGITRVGEALEWPVFTIEKHPGFYFIPEALKLEEQMHWIKESLLNFPQPPNRTNHTTAYGCLSDLWRRAQDGEVIEESTGTICVDDKLVASESHANGVCERNKSNGTFAVSKHHLSDSSRHLVREQHSNDNAVLRKTISMKSLLCKLRWATLGLQFDWSKTRSPRLEFGWAQRFKCIISLQINKVSMLLTNLHSYSLSLSLLQGAVLELKPGQPQVKCLVFRRPCQTTISYPSVGPVAVPHATAPSPQVKSCCSKPPINRGSTFVPHQFSTRAIPNTMLLRLLIITTVKAGGWYSSIIIHQLHQGAPEPIQ